MGPVGTQGQADERPRRLALPPVQRLHGPVPARRQARPGTAGDCQDDHQQLLAAELPDQGCRKPGRADSDGCDTYDHPGGDHRRLRRFLPARGEMVNGKLEHAGDIVYGGFLGHWPIVGLLQHVLRPVDHHPGHGSAQLLGRAEDARC